MNLMRPIAAQKIHKGGSGSGGAGTCNRDCWTDWLPSVDESR